MAVNEIIINIAANFTQQVQLYSKMLDLSVQQLHILEEGGGRGNADEIHLLLSERQKLMEVINQLSIGNKQLQIKISQELGMDEFVLARLEHVIDQTQYQDLKRLVAQLGETLRTISEQDEKSQQWMRQGLKSSARTSIKAGNEQVSNAYKQAMQQKPT